MKYCEILITNYETTTTTILVNNTMLYQQDKSNAAENPTTFAVNNC